MVRRRSAAALRARRAPDLSSKLRASDSANEEDHAAGEVVEDRRHDRGRRDREDPGPDDPAGDAPADRPRPLGRADADDGARDGVGRRDRDAPVGEGEDGDAAAGLRAGSAEGLEPRQVVPHRLHDAPTTEHRAEADGRVAGEHDPERDGELRGDAGIGGAVRPDRAVEDHADDPHHLLGVIGPVAVTEDGRRDELQPPEDPIDTGRRAPADDPAGEDHEERAERHADERREHDEARDLEDARRDEPAEAERRDGRADHAAGERVRRGGREPPDPREEVPDDRPHQRGEDHGEDHRAPLSLQVAEVDDPLPHRRRDLQLGAPEDRGGAGDGYACSRTTPSMMLATSSARSVAVSMKSMISFHFITWRGSLPRLKSIAIVLRVSVSAWFSMRLISLQASRMRVGSLFMSRSPFTASSILRACATRMPASSRAHTTSVHLSLKLYTGIPPSVTCRDSIN